MDDPREIRDRVIEAALSLGFERAGIAALFPPQTYAAFTDWLDRGYHGDMSFIATASHRGGRSDFEHLLTGAKSIVMVAAAYEPTPPAQSRHTGKIARYALGMDYHRVLKKKLAELAGSVRQIAGSSVQTRACVDTAPILERELAHRAGLGFIGKNTMLISPGLGSYTVLGGLLVDVEIAASDGPKGDDRCGQCTACIDACPTNAFKKEFVLDARKCVSYLTIEHRREIPEGLRSRMENHVFGCDICQQACPYNRAAPARTPPMPEFISEASPRSSPSLAKLLELRSGEYRRLTRGSAMNRARRSMLRRNAAIAIGNSDSPSVEECDALERTSRDTDPMISEAAKWALERTRCGSDEPREG